MYFRVHIEISIKLTSVRVDKYAVETQKYTHAAVIHTHQVAPWEVSSFLMNFFHSESFSEELTKLQIHTPLIHRSSGCLIPIHHTFSLIIILTLQATRLIVCCFLYYMEKRSHILSSGFSHSFKNI